jgi:hypothetical protein
VRRSFTRAFSSCVALVVAVQLPLLAQSTQTSSPQSVQSPASAQFAPHSATAQSAPHSAIAQSAPHPAPAQSAPAAVPADTVTRFGLSPVAGEIADELGVIGIIERLVQIKSSTAKTDSAVQLEHVTLKSQLTEMVLIASLQVRDVTARIDHEVVQLSRVHQLIQDRTDRGLKYNTLANVFGSGAINEAGQAAEMAKNELPGEIFELVAGATTLMLSGFAVKQQNGGSRRLPARPGLLAKPFGFAADSEADYPPIVWAYLTHVPIGGTTNQSRLQLLHRYWLMHQFSPDVRTPAGKRRAAMLAGVSSEPRVNMALLEDRTALLQDLRAEVIQVDRALLELLLNTQKL